MPLGQLQNSPQHSQRVQNPKTKASCQELTRRISKDKTHLQNVGLTGILGEVGDAAPGDTTVVDYANEVTGD